MKITIEIKDSRISELLHGHGGSISPWLGSVSGSWNSGNGAQVKYDREHDAEGDLTGRKATGRDAVLRGLTKMATGSPYQFSQFLEENDDDITFDVAWQYIIFGKLVYA